MAPEKHSVRMMFEEIAPRYDFLNHFLSMGIDRSWRRRVVREAGRTGARMILDVATGTGDLAIALARLEGCRITGVDLSPGMLEIGKQKIRAAGLQDRIILETADAENLPFPDNTFEAVTIAFGVRNFEDLGKGLREMRRVLKTGGQVLILEFSQPDTFPVRQLYRLYSALFIPVVGRIVSGHPSAYRYLPDTISAFPSGSGFLSVLSGNGFRDARQIRLAFGIASIYCAVK